MSPCGTPAAYKTHVSRGEQPCDDCRNANADYERARRARHRANPDAADERRKAARRREQDRQNAKRRSVYGGIPADVRERVEAFRARNPLWSATETAERLGIDVDTVRAVWARQDALVYGGAS